jgi:hypothetical protein
MKTAVYIGATVGGLIGGYVPTLWGAGFLSGWSILTSAIGGLLGIWVAWRVINW